MPISKFAENPLEALPVTVNLAGYLSEVFLYFHKPEETEAIRSKVGLDKDWMLLKVIEEGDTHSGVSADFEFKTVTVTCNKAGDPLRMPVKAVFCRTIC